MNRKNDIILNAIFLAFSAVLIYLLLVELGVPSGFASGFIFVVMFIERLVKAIKDDYPKTENTGTAMKVSELNPNEPIKVLCFCEVGAMDNEAHHRMIVERQDSSIRHLIVSKKEQPRLVRTGWIYQIRNGALVSIRD